MEGATMEMEHFKPNTRIQRACRGSGKGISMCSPDSMCAVHSLMRANSDFILNPHVAIPKGKETTGCMGALGSQHPTFLTVSYSRTKERSRMSSRKIQGFTSSSRQRRPSPLQKGYPRIVKQSPGSGAAWQTNSRNGKRFCWASYPRAQGMPSFGYLVGTCTRIVKRRVLYDRMDG
eukprot:scaffold815_cov363-Pavlova_lutheri.AAC.6